MVLVQLVLLVLLLMLVLLLVLMLMLILVQRAWLHHIINLFLSAFLNSHPAEPASGLLGWALQRERAKRGQSAQQTKREQGGSVSECVWLCSTACSDASENGSGKSSEQQRACWRHSSATQHNVPCRFATVRHVTHK